MTRHDFQPDWSEIFTEVQEHLTAWRREHPQATLAAIEAEAQRVLTRLQATLVQDLAQHSEAAFFSTHPPEERPVCPTRGVPVQPRGAKTRTLRGHGDQEVRLANMRPAPVASRLFSPLDEELGLRSGDLTPLLHERLVQPGNMVPSFGRAGELFTAFTGTPVSETTVRRYVERAGPVLLVLAPPPWRQETTHRTGCIRVSMRHMSP